MLLFDWNLYVKRNQNKSGIFGWIVNPCIDTTENDSHAAVVGMLPRSLTWVLLEEIEKEQPLFKTTPQLGSSAPGGRCGCLFFIHLSLL
jgi:hypothetical protein